MTDFANRRGFAFGYASRAVTRYAVHGMTGSSEGQSSAVSDDTAESMFYSATGIWPRRAVSFGFS